MVFANFLATLIFNNLFIFRHNIPTARYRNFTDYEEAIAYVKGIDYKVVVKASGIAAGKGVILPETTEEALEAVKEVMLDKAFGDAGAEVVIEECLEGKGCFTSGFFLLSLYHESTLLEDNTPFSIKACFLKKIEGD